MADGRGLAAPRTQRRRAAREWKAIRAAAPKVVLLGNLGIAQLIRTKPR